MSLQNAEGIELLERQRSNEQNEQQNGQPMSNNNNEIGENVNE